MFEITMVFKSGKEYHFSCSSYELTKSPLTGGLISFSYKGGSGNCPIYFKTEDIESIAVIAEGENWYERSE